MGVDVGGQFLGHFGQRQPIGTVRGVGTKSIGITVALVGIGVELNLEDLSRNDVAREGQRGLGKCLHRIFKDHSCIKQRSIGIEGLDAFAVLNCNGLICQRTGAHRSVLVVDHEQVPAALVVIAPVDDQSTLDIPNRVGRRRLECEDHWIDRYDRRGDDPRFGINRFAYSIADLRKLVGDVDDRIPEPPPVTTARLGNPGNNDLFDDIANTAVTYQAEGRVLCNLAQVPQGQLKDHIGQGPTANL